MSYINQTENLCLFIGRLGKDVEVKDGTKSSRFSLCTNLVTGKDESKKEKEIWVPFEIYNDHPTIPYLKKGVKIYVTSYYDATVVQKDDNHRDYFHAFKVKEITFLTAAKEAVS